MTISHGHRLLVQLVLQLNVGDVLIRGSSWYRLFHMTLLYELAYVSGALDAQWSYEKHYTAVLTQTRGSQYIGSLVHQPCGWLCIADEN